MSYGAYHHIVNLSNSHGPPIEYDIVGYLCETDTFTVNRPIAEIRRGDVLCMMNTGAYGYTMASNYNGRLRPAELLLHADGKAELLRRAETMDDMLKTDIGYVAGALD
jgi:diaminopimelate decarboxylase